MSNPLTPEILAALEYVGDGLTLEIAGHLWRKNRSELLRLARAGLTAETPHLYLGGCPDSDSPDSRDPACPACRLLGFVESRCRDCRSYDGGHCDKLSPNDPEVQAFVDRGCHCDDPYDLVYAATPCPGFTAKETP